MRTVTVLFDAPMRYNLMLRTIIRDVSSNMLRAGVPRSKESAPAGYSDMTVEDAVETIIHRAAAVHPFIIDNQPLTADAKIGSGPSPYTIEISWYKKGRKAYWLHYDLRYGRQQKVQLHDATY